MRLSDFESLIHGLSADVPPPFFDGVAEVVVSPKSVPHPTRAEIYLNGATESRTPPTDEPPPQPQQ